MHSGQLLPSETMKRRVLLRSAKGDEWRFVTQFTFNL